MDVGEGEGKRLGLPGMRGTRLTGTLGRQALSDRLALKPYWGKPTVRNFRGGDGDVGIIEARSAPSLYPTLISSARCTAESAQTPSPTRTSQNSPPASL